QSYAAGYSGFSGIPNKRSLSGTQTCVLRFIGYIGASNEFLDITNGGVAGLVIRRRKEQNLFLNNVYDSSH
ncbi:hypothetical protein KVP97_21860, partial [Escherichia coli]|nr:hypothetical protein [Escherichia coli]